LPFLSKKELVVPFFTLSWYQFSPALKLTKEIPAKGLTLADIFCTFIPENLICLFGLFRSTKTGEIFQRSNIV
jgi:hypothetical protein